MIVSYDTIITMTPPYKITSKILFLVSEVSGLIGKYEGLLSPRPTPKLRKQNRIKTIHGTLSIEGNTLSLKQITAIVENKRVIGPPSDILEVNNAIKVYDELNKLRSKSIDSFCCAHKMLMRGLVKEAGKFRSASVGILKAGKVSHLAPKASLVHGLMKELFLYLKQNKDHALIQSSVFHYELEFIHPFLDGNGRMGRLWQSVLLYNYHPIFEYIPIESVIKENQKAYYKALESSDKNGESTPFIEFMLSIIHQSMLDFFKMFKPEPITAEDRIKKAKEHFGASSFSRGDYINYFKSISSATASRDLADAVKKKMLMKQGDKRLSVYKFIK
jgi:Fic family protein